MRKARVLILVLILSFLPTLSFAYGLPLQSLSIQLQGKHRLSRIWPDHLLSFNEAASWALELFQPQQRFDVILWSHSAPSTPSALARRWGLGLDELLLLNPGLTKDSELEANQPLVVFRFDPDSPPQSMGRSSNGHLVSGMPMPEGPFWEMRASRARHWGAKSTITLLASAFTKYGLTFPGAPTIRLGDISRKQGGKLRPHRSHRSGRDVDLGYIPKMASSGHWAKVTSKTIDAEKNWFLLKTLLDSGMVQAVYMDRRLQRVIAKRARQDLPKEEVDKLFEYSGKRNKDAIIRHWSGHYSHMHIRFHCEPWNAQCKTW